MPVVLPTLAQLANDVATLRRQLEEARRERLEMQRLLIEQRRAGERAEGESSAVLQRREPRIIVVPSTTPDDSQSDDAPDVYRGPSALPVLPTIDPFPVPLPEPDLDKDGTEGEPAGSAEPPREVRTPEGSEDTPAPEPAAPEDTSVAKLTADAPPQVGGPDLQSPPEAASLLTAKLQENLASESTSSLPTPGDAYAKALEWLRAGDYDNASTALTDFLDRYKDAKQAPNARYWLAEIDFVRMDYQSAIRRFIENLETDSFQSPKGNENLLKLGMSYAASGRQEDACETFARFNDFDAPLQGYLANTLQREIRRSAC